MGHTSSFVIVLDDALPYRFIKAEMFHLSCLGKSPKTSGSLSMTYSGTVSSTRRSSGPLLTSRPLSFIVRRH